MSFFWSQFFNLSKRYIMTSIKRSSKMPDPLELATGLEKKELLARKAGITTPFDERIIDRGPGTRDCPTEIPSAFEKRIVGCICEEEAMHIKWMWLHQGCPRRCYCGYWFTLVYKSPLGDPC